MITLIFFLAIANSKFAESPDFFREKIDITVQDNTCEVQGKYYFKNESDTDISRMLYYPFVINENLSFPDSISVENKVSEKELDYFTSKSAISFPLYVPAKSVVIIDVYYSQKVKENNFEYILLTTQKWGKPLDYAEYLIKIPKIYKIKSLSYPFFKMESEGEISILSMEQTNFEPDKNIIIQWEG